MKPRSSTGHSKNRLQVGVASLAEIMIDPYYRTLFGFCVLIEKDWVSFAYPFYCTSSFLDNFFLRVLS